MQQSITQQLQHTQQLCTNAMQLFQQVAQELNQISQSVQTTSYTQPSYNQGYSSQGGYQNANYGYSQTSMSGGGSAGVSAVMKADRNYDIQKSTPSNRNYNTQGSQYTPQTMQYSSHSPSSYGGGGSGVQSVMAADRMSSVEGSSQGSRSSSQYGGSSPSSSFGGSGRGSSGIGSVMQADRYSSTY